MKIRNDTTYHSTQTFTIVLILVLNSFFTVAFNVNINHSFIVSELFTLYGILVITGIARVSMSHNVSVATVTSQDTTSSGRTPEDYVENTTSSSGNIASQADYYEVKKKLEEREKLKEELLRQYEAGHLKTQMCSLGAVSSTVPTLLSGNTNHPRQIPTIEEHRAASTSTMVRRTVSLTRPLHLPDVSRPPPGYNFPLAAVTQPVPTSTPVPSVPLFQPTPTPTPYTYEVSA